MVNELVFVSDGQQAIELIKQNDKQTFAMLLLDYNMPYKSGIDVLKAVKMNYLLNEATMPRVVFLSSYISDELKKKAEIHGVTDFI